MVLEHYTPASYGQTRKHNLCYKSVSTVRDTGVRHMMKLYKPHTPSNGARTSYHICIFQNNDERSINYKKPQVVSPGVFPPKQTGQAWNCVDKTLLIRNDSMLLRNQWQSMTPLKTQLRWQVKNNQDLQISSSHNIMMQMNWAWFPLHAMWLQKRLQKDLQKPKNDIFSILKNFLSERPTVDKETSPRVMLTGVHWNGPFSLQ